MLFSYNWLQDYLREKLPAPEKLAELLTLHFAEVEGIRKFGSDYVFDIDVRPNRAGDCFSHLGIARECGALTNSKFKIQNSKLKEEREPKTSDLVEVEIRDKKACFRYSARVILGVRTAPAPAWIRARLEACGLKAINNIVDVANYVMLETGQPLHVFDFDKIAPFSSRRKKIVVRFAKKGEKITTLDNQEYELEKDVLVIADRKKPLGIAGIKGGLEAGIDDQTKTVVLESANFEPRTIRRGGQLLRLKSDASWRFEHGIDPNLTQLALDRAASLIQELAKGRIARGRVDFYPEPVRVKRIKFAVDRVEELLGIKIPQREIVKILKSLSFTVRRLGPGLLEVGIPTSRIDVLIPEDLVEEVGRIHGYQKIPANPPRAALVSPERNLEIFWEEIARDVLKESGLVEVYNYSFIGDQEREIFGEPKQGLVELENPLSTNSRYLVPNLLANLLKNVKDNLRYFDEVRIFELGKIFRKSRAPSSQFPIEEKRMLSGLIASDQREEPFYQLKGIVDVLLEKIGIGGVWYDEYQPLPEESQASFWNLGKSAEIKVGDREIGFLGEVSSKILAGLKIQRAVVAFDLDFDGLAEMASEEREYRPPSAYPATIRDIAILVPAQVKVAEVLSIINEAGGVLVVDVDLFDLYQSEELAEGKKSLAFRIVYQAENRTLTSKEVEATYQNIVKALEENPEWEVRK